MHKTIFGLNVIILAMLSWLTLTHSQAGIKSHIQPQDETYEVLLVHRCHKPHPVKELNDIKEGHYLLVVKDKNKILFFNNLEQLKAYDSNNDNIIDHNDVVFSKLYLASYDKKAQRFKYQPLSKTSIRGFKLHHNGNILTLRTPALKQPCSLVPAWQFDSL